MGYHPHMSPVMVGFTSLRTEVGIGAEVATETVMAARAALVVFKISKILSGPGFRLFWARDISLLDKS